jgi:hypothetical protein
MGELRSALAAPSAASWARIGELLGEWPDVEALREQVVPYVERALEAWPDEVWREAPAGWAAVDAPLYRLTRPLAIKLVPMDQALWQEAVAATASLSDEPATEAPERFEALLDDTYPGAMRANALAAAHYLTHGLGLAPTTWRTSAARYAGFVHHGDLIVEGDMSFTRASGEQRANLITGGLTVSGTIEGVAFDGELAVGGDVRCGALVSDADLAFGGELHARYVRLSWYDCCWAGGDVYAEVFVDHGMGMGSGEVHARLHIQCEDHRTNVPRESFDSLREVLCDELEEVMFEGLDLEGDEDEEALDVLYERLDEIVMPALLAGRPVFR